MFIKLITTFFVFETFIQFLSLKYFIYLVAKFSILLKYSNHDKLEYFFPFVLKVSRYVLWGEFLGLIGKFSVIDFAWILIVYTFNNVLSHYHILSFILIEIIFFFMNLFLQIIIWLFSCIHNSNISLMDIMFLSLNDWKI